MKKAKTLLLVMVVILCVASVVAYYLHKTDNKPKPVSTKVPAASKTNDPKTLIPGTLPPR